jgi:hypothetical protein
MRTKEGENRREKKKGCFPLAQPDPRVRKRGELCFLCPNQTRNKREGEGERAALPNERETELEREMAVAFFGDGQWPFRRNC